MKRLLPAVAVLLLLATAACGSDDTPAIDSPGTTAAAGGASTDGGDVEVIATDDACTPERTTFEAGKTTFVVKNEGKQVTELYVYAAGDRIVSEVENVGPGTSRKLTVDLKAGDYELACKPGQTGKGIRTPIEVEGQGGSQGGQQAKASREVEVEAKEFAFSGLEDFTAKAGETVEFKLENKGEIQHELEVFGTDGKELGEVEPVNPGETGEAYVTLPAAGTYTYLCGIDGHAGKGMKGSFTVSA